MKTYDRSDAGSAEVREHPWTVASSDPSARYYDLKAEPERIRTCLEDFIPWKDWPAIETFYRLLEWLNGDDSLLESNDCAFSGPSPNYTAEFPKALEATGRLMILFRELPLNLSRENIDWLTAALHHHLAEIDPTLAHGVVGVTVYPVRYVTIPVAGNQQSGFQVMLSFWSWGDTIDEVMENLRRTLQGLSNALRSVQREARDALAPTDQ